MAMGAAGGVRTAGGGMVSTYLESFKRLESEAAPLE